MRDHIPQPITNFNGLWARGDFDSCPPDHFTDCANVVYGENSVQGRLPFINNYGLGVRALRQQIYTSNVAGVQTIFLMTLADNFHFYSQKLSPVLGAPVDISVAPITGSPTDFQLVNFNGRAYITFSDATVGVSVAAFFKGACYLYDGTTFRVAGSTRPLVGAWNIAQGAGGTINAGSHAFAVAFETNTGFISSLAFWPITLLFAAGDQANMTNIPVDPSGIAVARRIYMTKVMSDVVPVNQGTYYFLGRIADNVTTAASFTAFDSQLLQNDTYLYTVLDSLPNGVGIGKYHNRLMLWGFPTQTITIRTIGGGPNITLTTTPSTILFSLPNDPETIDTLNNVAIVDANASSLIQDVSGAWVPIGVTACQEYRDMCYVFKSSKTYAFADNGDVPATWVPTVVDEGSGAFVKGVATVLDTNGVSYDYLVIANNTGVYTFNGLFVRPELTYKIADLWKNLNKIPGLFSSNLDSGKVHIVLDTINKQLYIMAQFGQQFLNQSLQNNILVCDYNNSFIGDPSFSAKAKWSFWTFKDPITLANLAGTSIPSLDTFIPISLTGWDTGNQFALILNNRVDNNNYAYGGNGGIPLSTSIAYKTEKVPGPFFQTNLIGDSESNIVHLGAIRYSLNLNPVTPNFASSPAIWNYYGVANSPIAFISAGSEVPAKMHTTIVNQDLTSSKNLMDINVTIKMAKEPLLLANWSSQRFMIKVSFDDNIYFSLNRIIPFVKSTYTQGRG